MKLPKIGCPRLSKYDEKIIDELLGTKDLGKIFGRVLEGHFRIVITTQRILHKQLLNDPGKFTDRALIATYRTATEQVLAALKMIQDLQRMARSQQDPPDIDLEDALEAALEIEKKRVH